MLKPDAVDTAGAYGEESQKAAVDSAPAPESFKVEKSSGSLGSTSSKTIFDGRGDVIPL